VDFSGNAETVKTENYTLDLGPPQVTSFAVPVAFSSTVIPIIGVTASDDVGVTGYLVTATPASPTPGDPGWSATPPTSFTVGAAGPFTLYAWAKDGLGQVSTSRSATGTVDTTTQPVLVDETAPFSNLQPALSSVTTVPRTIKAWGTLFTEDVDYNNTNGVTATLKGGYDTTFGSTPGMTFLDGSLTITNGSVVVDRLSIR
jgi:hypothetical protein